MRKIVWAITMILFLSSCYEDKGNYDYNFDKLNQIEAIHLSPEPVKSLGGNLIELQQPLREEDTHKRIEVKVDQSIAKDTKNLSFRWIKSYKINPDDEETVKDTIYTNGYLEVDLPIGKEKEYGVFLEIKDKETTLAHYSYFRVKTRPIFKNSLFVLHGENGARKLGNIERIGTETKVYADASTVVSTDDKTNPFRNAVALSSISFMTQDETDKKRRSIEKDVLTVFNSDATLAGYNPFGLSKEYPSDFLMPSNEKTFVFSRNIETGDPTNGTYFHCVLSRDGQFLLGKEIPCLYKPAGGIQEGDNPLNQTDYQVTSATITESRFILWDAKNERFLYVSKGDSYPWMLGNANRVVLSNPVLDANVDFSHLTPVTTPKGKKAVYAYIQYRENYSASHPYFIFKDENSGKYYHYELMALDADGKGGKGDKGGKGSTGGGDNTPSFSILSVKELSGFNPDENTIVYNSWFTSNILFYAEDGRVYKYNTSNGDKNVIYSAPAGYDISVLKFRTSVSSHFADDLGRYLCIGMNKGSQGAVAEIKLTIASDLDPAYKPVFYDKDDKGQTFGVIQDLQFAHEYFYKVPE
ncbi:MAG: hypothetical protein KGV44_14930 [Flavobacteriaceae bacterium]|nr:hypothetical protein [Flavobacteriaceae bacterium]